MRKLNIGVCDDDALFCRLFREAVQHAATDLKLHYEIFSYNSGITLLEDFNLGIQCDVYLLDIEMPGVSGVEVAKAIRSRLTFGQASLLFISGHTRYHEDLLNLQPYAFLHKSRDMGQLSVRLAELFRIIGEQHPLYEFRMHKKAHYVRFEDIISLESDGRKLVLNYWEANGDHAAVTFYGSLRQEAEKFPYPDFFSPHASYLVHFRYVRQISKKMILMRDNSKIPVTRARWPITEKAWRSYRGE